MSLYSALSRHAAHLPDALQGMAADFCVQLSEKIPAERLSCFEHEDFAASILKVCCCSRFISETWLRHPQLLPYSG